MDSHDHRAETTTPITTTDAAPATRLYALATACGLVHAAASTYWASGGTVLLETVGAWALDWRQRDPGGATLVLALAALAKLVAALVPSAVHRGRLPWPRFWRRLTWAGATVLVLWGGMNMVAAWCQLAGLWAMPDRAGTLGHAALWDPLFVVWGAALLGALWTSSPARAVSPAARCDGRPSPGSAA